MSRSIGSIRVMIIALMAIAMALGWPSAGDTDYGAMAEAAPAHKHALQHETGQGGAPGGCERHAADCCAMAHCHPGIAPHGAEVADLRPAIERRHSPAAFRAGQEPDVALPPPRILLPWPSINE